MSIDDNKIHNVVTVAGAATLVAMFARELIHDVTDATPSIDGNPLTEDFVVEMALSDLQKRLTLMDAEV